MAEEEAVEKAVFGEQAQQPHHPMSQFELAARTGNMEQLRGLHQAVGEEAFARAVRKPDGSGKLAVHHAANIGSVPCIELLLEVPNHPECVGPHEDSMCMRLAHAGGPRGGPNPNPNSSVFLFQ